MSFQRFNVNFSLLAKMILSNKKAESLFTVKCIDHSASLLPTRAIYCRSHGPKLMRNIPASCAQNNGMRDPALFFSRTRLV